MRKSGSRVAYSAPVSTLRFRWTFALCLHNAQFAIAIERNLYVTCHFVRNVSRVGVLTDCVDERETPAGLFDGIGR